MKSNLLKLSLSKVGQRLGEKARKKLSDVLNGVDAEDYLEFLKHHNGGDATGYWFKIRGSKEKQYVDTFLSASDSKGYPTSLFLVKKNAEGFIPEDAIPVAFVNGENLVIMRTVSRRANKIQIKISADVADPNDPEDGIKSVAGSFRKFIELLRFASVEELEEDDYGLY